VVTGIVVPVALLDHAAYHNPLEYPQLKLIFTNRMSAERRVFDKKH